MTIHQQYFHSLHLSHSSHSLLGQFLSDHQETLHCGTSIFFTQVLSPKYDKKKFPLKELRESCVFLGSSEPEQSDLNIWCMRHANGLKELTSEDALELSILLRSSFKRLSKLRKQMFSRTVHSALQALPKMVCKMVVVIHEGEIEVRNVDCKGDLWECVCCFGPSTNSTNFIVPQDLPHSAPQAFITKYEKEERSVMTYVNGDGSWERKC